MRSENKMRTITKRMSISFSFSTIAVDPQFVFLALEWTFKVMLASSSISCAPYRPFSTHSPFLPRHHTPLPAFAHEVSPVLTPTMYNSPLPRLPTPTTTQCSPNLNSTPLSPPLVGTTWCCYGQQRLGWVCHQTREPLQGNKISS